MGATASRPSATAPRGRRPAGRPRRPPLPLPAGAVRASSIFPILSVTLLFFGGLCVAASELHRSRYNVILSAGIFFVSAGGCHPPPRPELCMGTGPGGGHGDRRMLCRGPAGGPSRARHEAGRGPGRSSRLRAGRAVVVRVACALRAGPRARRVRPPGRPPPRPSAVRAPANSGSRLPECSIPHVTHGISGSKAETGRPTRSGGRPMTALTRRRPGSQGGQRRSSRRGPSSPPPSPPLLRAPRPGPFPLRPPPSSISSCPVQGARRGWGSGPADGTRLSADGLALCPAAAESLLGRGQRERTERWVRGVPPPGFGFPLPLGPAPCASGASAVAWDPLTAPASQALARPAPVPTPPRL